MLRCYLSGNEEHDRVIRAFYEGCPEKKVLVKGWAYQPSEVAVIFGVYKSKVPVSYPRGEIFRRQREQKLDVVVLETGYINRGSEESHHYAAGFNGLNGRADFRNKGMPPDRFEALGAELKPKSQGEDIILCAQVPWDASVEGTDHLAWLKWTANELGRFSRRKAVFRPHPLVKLDPLPGFEYSTVPLAEDLKRAWAVVTFNSNSGVEATVSGVPVFVADKGSMAWEVANKRLSEIESPKIFERRQWANDLAYAQWTPAEMREGLTWRHLSR